MPRAHFHDYRSRCYYHITISKLDFIEAFSHISGPLPLVQVERSPLGRIIEEEIQNFPQYDPKLRVHQYVIMPDHIHLLVFTTDRLEKALGSYIGKFKSEIKRKYGCGSIFKSDFYDRILRPCHSLNEIYEYIRANPRRLLIRKERPHFFKRVRSVWINDEEWEAYGNLQLFANPFRSAVIIHRRYSIEERKRLEAEWMHLAENGGVLISPYISQDEKRIRAEIEERNGKQIRIVNEQFGERYRPGAHDFALCEEGKLLLIAPKESMDFSRACCLRMNGLAEKLAEPGVSLVMGTDEKSEEDEKRRNG